MPHDSKIETVVLKKYSSYSKALQFQFQDASQKMQNPLSLYSLSQWLHHPESLHKCHTLSNTGPLSEQLFPLFSRSKAAECMGVQFHLLKSAMWLCGPPAAISSLSVNLCGSSWETAGAFWWTQLRQLLNFLLKTKPLGCQSKVGRGCSGSPCSVFLASTASLNCFYVFFSWSLFFFFPHRMRGRIGIRRLG